MVKPSCTDSADSVGGVNYVKTGRRQIKASCTLSAKCADGGNDTDYADTADNDNTKRIKESENIADSMSYANVKAFVKERRFWDMNSVRTTLIERKVQIFTR